MNLPNCMMKPEWQQNVWKNVMIWSCGSVKENMYTLQWNWRWSISHWHHFSRKNMTAVRERLRRNRNRRNNRNQHWKKWMTRMNIMKVQKRLLTYKKSRSESQWQKELMNLKFRKFLRRKYRCRKLLYRKRFHRKYQCRKLLYKKRFRRKKL